MASYAFVDVHNTEGTAHKLYGFSVDWHKLCEYLASKWGCRKVFFYAGIEDGDDETAKEFDSLAKLACSVVRTKAIKVYKKPDRKVEVLCSNCGNANVAIVEMGYDKKGNCDVDLTIDALDNAAPNNEYYIFTGDGDFAPLITEAMAKGVAKIHVVSSGRAFIRAGISNKRLATKLRGLFKQYPQKVDLIDIASLKFRIKRDLPT
jgi:uncharacterized LabA/DUF88 family protein